MRARLVLLGAMFAASACAQTPPPKPLNMANPAAVYCKQLGGRGEILSTPGGQIGICHLPGGRACEEWALFRDHRCTLPRPPVGH